MTGGQKEPINKIYLHKPLLKNSHPPPPGFGTSCYGMELQFEETPNEERYDGRLCWNGCHHWLS